MTLLEVILFFWICILTSCVIFLMWVAFEAVPRSIHRLWNEFERRDRE